MSQTAAGATGGSVRVVGGAVKGAARVVGALGETAAAVPVPGSVLVRRTGGEREGIHAQ